MERPSCTIDGCPRTQRGGSRGWCATHYMRWWKHGDPLALFPRGNGRPKLADTCSIDGCRHKGPFVRGWCPSHYNKWKNYGDPLAPDPRKHKRGLPCKVDGCASGTHLRGYCVMHYARVMKYGDSGEVGRRTRERGTGSITSDGYHAVTVDGKKRGAHRVVMEEMIGRPLQPYENVHHINGIKTDNRPENLELWVTTQPKGQRPVDLVAFIVEHYPELVHEVLSRAE